MAIHNTRKGAAVGRALFLSAWTLLGSVVGAAVMRLLIEPRTDTLMQAIYIITGIICGGGVGQLTGEHILTKKG